MIRVAINVFNALRKRVGEPWEVIEINDTLLDLKREIGGWIETVTLAEDVVILCDEDGRLKDRPYNCEIGGIMFVGTIMICGASGEEFASCPEDVVEAFAGTDEYCYEI